MQAFKNAAAILQTATQLTFTQLHNVMAALAHAWQFKLFAWQHADVVVIKVRVFVGSSAGVQYDNGCAVRVQCYYCCYNC